MKKILIIDYDQNSLSSLQGVFARHGYQVVTAADGQIGWDKYNKESPDLVLMEAMLPKVHGFELCQRITSERNSQATVFIMTGVYKDRVYRTEALRTYGASEYFEKPLKMADLVASVEAVLGKPEPRPAEALPAAAVPIPGAEPTAAQAAPAQPAASSGAGSKPAPADPRRRERTRSDDRLFSLPEDLDRLSKELPKVRKPASVRSEPAEEAKFEAVADELLKSVLIESTAPKTVQPKPGDGNGNGNGNGRGADIDQFLKTALAGFDLNKEKVKAAKPVPPPAPPAPAPEKDKPAPAAVKPAVPEAKPTPPPPAPLKERPVPAPMKAAVPGTRPTPPPPPPPPAPPVPAKDKPAPSRIFSAPAPADLKTTLTPGDPGSDVSPFFTPEKSKPAGKPVERAETPRREPARHEPERREPAKATPPVPAPAPAAAPAPVLERSEARVIASAGIFQDIAAPKERQGFPKLILVLLGVVAVAAVAFVLLRPKRPAPAPPVEPATQTVTQTETEPQPVEVPPPPVAKPAPKQKAAQPQAKPADTGASAILPTETAALVLPQPGTQNGPGAVGNPSPSGSGAAASDAAQAKTQDNAPPTAKTETDPSQNQNPATETTTAPAAPAPAAGTAPPNLGDLVDLASVTVPPRLVKRVDPIYPQTAQRVGREGSITVNALIDEKGNVIDTGILKGIQDDKGLAKAAEIAVRKWKFEPARKNGVAVKVWKPFVIAFKAEANPAN